MNYEVFHPSNGSPVFCTRYAILAKWVAWAIGLDWEISGIGWSDWEDRPNGWPKRIRLDGPDEQDNQTLEPLEVWQIWDE